MRLFLSYAIMFFLLTGCTTARYIPVESVRTDSVYITKEIHDTVTDNIRDSIYHTIFQIGDTIYDTKYVEKTRFKNVVIRETDTISQDSVVIQREEKIVERKVVPKWCYFSLVLCVFLAILLFVRRIL